MVHWMLRFSHVSKGKCCFGNLENRVWSNRGITIGTKVSFYKICILTTLLYSSEIWTMHWRHIQWLEHFHQKCLRSILNIKWQSLAPDTDVLQRSHCTSIEAMLILNQMCWVGHIMRMEANRLPKQLSYRELLTAKHPQHKPRKGLRTI